MKLCVIGKRDRATQLSSIFLPLVSVAVVLVFGSTNALAFTLPGISPSGQPVFVNNVTVRVNTKNQTFKAFTDGEGRGFSLLAGGNEYFGSGGYTLKGSYSGSGVLNPGGTVQLRGSLPDLGITGGGNVLFSADLTAWNNTDDPNLWGFNTANIFCSPLLEAALGVTSCTTNESVYITLNSPFGGFGSNYSGTGTAYSTIPVPAAAWLFGSALGLLGWVRRRSRAAAAEKGRLSH